MGTRADFYIGRGVDALWLGSIAMDGYPDGIPANVLRAKRPGAFKVALDKFFAETDHATLPADGWPWPWDDSCTTDYAYAFDGGKVYAAAFGSKWYSPKTVDKHDPPDEKRCVFPNMSQQKNVTFGRRSGLLVVRAASPTNTETNER